jgi:hypothetical protein
MSGTSEFYPGFAHWICPAFLSLLEGFQEPIEKKLLPLHLQTFQAVAIALNPQTKPSKK